MMIGYTKVAKEGSGFRGQPHAQCHAMSVRQARRCDRAPGAYQQRARHHKSRRAVDGTRDVSGTLAANSMQNRLPAVAFPKFCSIESQQ
jgi:hypothetical protein